MVVPWNTMPMNSAATTGRGRALSAALGSRPSPLSTINRMTGKVVSAVIAVVIGRAQVTAIPSRTSPMARKRFAGVMRFSVPSSSCSPQRPQLLYVSMYLRTSASVGSVAVIAPPACIKAYRQCKRSVAHDHCCWRTSFPLQWNSCRTTDYQASLPCYESIGLLFQAVIPTIQVSKDFCLDTLLCVGFAGDRGRPRSWCRPPQLPLHRATALQHCRQEACEDSDMVLIGDE